MFHQFGDIITSSVRFCFVMWMESPKRHLDLWTGLGSWDLLVRPPLSGESCSLCSSVGGPVLLLWSPDLPFGGSAHSLGSIPPTSVYTAPPPPHLALYHSALQLPPPPTRLPHKHEQTKTCGIDKSHHRVFILTSSWKIFPL